MKQIVLSILLALVARIGLAQHTLSLNDAVRTALANRYDLKIQKINTDVVKKQLSEVTTRSLPQITSDLDVRYNSQLQTNIIPGDVLGPSASGNREVQFGTTYSTLWGFNLNQNIFNPGNLSDRKIAKLQSEYQGQNEKLTEANIKQDVTEAYFSVLLWKEKMKLSGVNIIRAEEAYKVAADQLNKGQATTNDVQRTNVDLENAKATNEQNKKSYDLSVSDLLYKMAVDSIKNPVLTNDIPGMMEQYKLIPSGNEEIQRAELQQEKIQFDIYNRNTKKQELNWLPNLSVYGNYSLQYMNNDFAPFGSKNWYPFNYFGIKASFPIFDGGLKSKTRQEYELRANASKYQYEKLKNDYKQETRSAETTLDNALIDLTYQKKILGLLRIYIKLMPNDLKTERSSKAT